MDPITRRPLEIGWRYSLCPQSCGELHARDSELTALSINSAICWNVRVSAGTDPTRSVTIRAVRKISRLGQILAYPNDHNEGSDREVG